MAWDLSNVIINLKARISEISAQIPGLATTSKAGIVKPDGSTITIDDGVISAPVATTETAGIVKPDGTTITIEDGVISAAGPESVTITKTSDETWASIVGRLYNAIDTSKLRGTSYIKCELLDSNNIYYIRLIRNAAGSWIFSGTYESSGSGETGCTVYMGAVVRVTNFSNGNKSSVTDNNYPGETITLYY